jgi:hypothetical protein
MFVILQGNAENGFRAWPVANTDGRFFEQILFWMRHCYQSWFGWMFEVMMTAPNTYQKPTVRDELSD